MIMEKAVIMYSDCKLSVVLLVSVTSGKFALSKLKEVQTQNSEIFHCLEEPYQRRNDLRKYILDTKMYLFYHICIEGIL